VVLRRVGEEDSENEEGGERRGEPRWVREGGAVFGWHFLCCGGDMSGFGLTLSLVMMWER